MLSLKRLNVDSRCPSFDLHVCRCKVPLAFVTNRKPEQVHFALLATLTCLTSTQFLPPKLVLRFSKLVYLFEHVIALSSAVYTFFALFEYIVVLTNMGFHMTSAIDFRGQHLTFDWRHGLQIHYL